MRAKSTCKFGAHDKGLACLGVDNYSGKKCEAIAERFAGNSSLGGGCLQARAKWSFSLCENIMEMIPTESARRTENMIVGITSIGVTVAKIRPLE